ncbi:MAG: cation diffusion facilitator family transporter [Hydrogenophilus sp.]|nr:cation diffusion facilitator family transporter [Hydrogenophilus sp.]
MIPSSPTTALDPQRRARHLSRISLIAAALNTLLALLQILIGIAAHAFSLIADAVHTLADLATDTLIAWAGRRAGDPPDDNHPYGHGRFETLAHLTLGFILILVGAGFIWAAGDRLQTLAHRPPVEPPALLVALTVLLAKELLYHFLKRAARRLAAPLLYAAAWHARSDAASSLVVAVGIGASLLGYSVLEPIAAAIVGFLIAAMGAKFAYRAAAELSDTSLPPPEVAAIAATIRATPGVVDLHELRTRRSGAQILLDAHVQVAPRITVSEGHRIADAVVHRLKSHHPAIVSVTIHIDHEPDQLPSPVSSSLPDRTHLFSTLAQLLELPDLPADAVQLHYLNGTLEIDLLLPADTPRFAPHLLDPRARRLLEKHLHQHLPLATVRWYLSLDPLSSPSSFPSSSPSFSSFPPSSSSSSSSSPPSSSPSFSSSPLTSPSASSFSFPSPPPSPQNEANIPKIEPDCSKKEPTP